MASRSTSTLRPPVDHVDLTCFEFVRLREFSLLIMSDACCLSGWLDSLEDEVKNYISYEAFQNFSGFVSSLIGHSRRIFEICKSHDLFLDLPPDL